MKEINKKELVKKLIEFRRMVQKQKDLNSPIQILDTAKNFLIWAGYLTQKEYEKAILKLTPLQDT